MGRFAHLPLMSLRLLSSVHHTCSLALVFREATSDDVFFARKILFQEAMNPLSVSMRTLLVAHDVENQDILGFGQIRPLDGQYSELASLYVLPDYRGQGIGSSVVEELLKRHEDGTKVCLLTLRPTTSFYEAHGFLPIESSNDLPASVQFEFKAGSLISIVLGNDLVCMVR